MFLVSLHSCLCSIHWIQVLSWEWRCSWSSADRRCSNYIWVINNFIAYEGATYTRGFTVCKRYSLTWHLIGWQLCCQPIRSHAMKLLLTNTQLMIRATQIQSDCHFVNIVLLGDLNQDLDFEFRTSFCGENILSMVRIMLTKWNWCIDWTRAIIIIKKEINIFLLMFGYPHTVYVLLVVWSINISMSDIS